VTEKTLVLIKPDAVKRGLVGEFIARFEKASLKIIGFKMVQADRQLAGKHYPTTKEWLLKVGRNTLSDCKKYGIDVCESLGTDNPLEIGQMVEGWNKEFLMSGPVIVLVLAGDHAIENVRMIVGSTIPTIALPGTIRGDYALDSAISANARKRAVYNLIHASGSKDEAEREITLWFKKGELFSYTRLEEYLYGE